MDPKSFIKKLKLFLKDADASVPEFCHAFELKERTIRAWIKGETKPTLDSIAEVQKKMQHGRAELCRTLDALDNFFDAE